MIPSANVLAWGEHAPWPALRQIEQDLIISRALCDIFSDPLLSSRVAFRGGTAINKLIFPKPLRYSEDIDLVQTVDEPTGEMIGALRKVLSWLGQCRVSPSRHSTHLQFRFSPEDSPETSLNIKIEINIAEHQNLFGLRKYPYSVANPWFNGGAEIVSFDANELFGTKLRAFLQRRKNRDLFDFQEGLARATLDADSVVAAFQHYLGLEEKTISRAEAEERILEKFNHDLTEDVVPLLPVGVEFTRQAAVAAIEAVWKTFVPRLNGASWKLTPQVLTEVRKSLPSFLA